MRKEGRKVSGFRMVTVSLWLLWFWSAVPSEPKTPESEEHAHKNTLNSMMVLRKELKFRSKTFSFKDPDWSSHTVTC